MNCDQYLYNFLCRANGVSHADRHAEITLLSIQNHAETDTRIDLFRRFMGMSGFTNLPYLVFAQYVQMLGASNIKMEELFAVDADWTKIHVNYR